MQEVSKRRSIAIGLRAHYPTMARLLAFVLLASGIAFVGVFRLRAVRHAQIVAVVGIPVIWIANPEGGD